MFWAYNLFVGIKNEEFKAPAAFLKGVYNEVNDREKTQGQRRNPKFFTRENLITVGGAVKFIKYG